MYGKQHSPVSLTHGNFLDPIQLPNEILQKVDVVFCNNVAFEPELNSQLCDRFMDMKDSAKIVSLVSFGKRKVNKKFMEPVKDHRIKVPLPKSWMFHCEGCGMKGENLDDGEAMVQCASCEVWMHMSCVGIAEHARVPKRWVCRGCCWEEQKQSRSAEQEILKVEGPYVCDVPGAVSWTSNAISYYIHTIEHSSVLHEGSEKLYESVHAQQARAAKRKRAQMNRREHRGGNRRASFKKAAVEPNAVDSAAAGNVGVPEAAQSILVDETAPTEQGNLVVDGSEAAADEAAAKEHGPEAAAVVQPVAQAHQTAELACTMEAGVSTQVTQLLQPDSQAAEQRVGHENVQHTQPWLDYDKESNRHQTGQCTTEQAAPSDGKMQPPDQQQITPTAVQLEEGAVVEQLPANLAPRDSVESVADSLKTIAAEPTQCTNEPAANMKPHRCVVHQAMMQWSYKEVEITD